jgi:hypothetical protein
MWVLGGRILCRGGGPVGYVWDEDEHVYMYVHVVHVHMLGLINVISDTVHIHVCSVFPGQRGNL